MKFGICHLSTIPLRKEPSDRSELVTQLLFGESYKVVKSEEKWLYISCSHDDYRGWMDLNQFFELSKSSFNALSDTNIPIASELAAPLELRSRVFPILLASSLPKVEELPFNYQGELIHYKATSFSRQQLIEHAFMYLNAPYLWGGRSPFGIDCSGFTQVVYKLTGIPIPRDASQQAKVGESLSFIEEAEEGDLAFFDNEDGKIIHVGIMLKNNQIIHAHGKVRIDKIDHQGIYKSESRDYSHHLRLMKKVISA